ncbi:TetR/AcrR family transcriptional regulator [Acetanaerobacterium elongatum]|nr:TetR/AcrR family transcriptional regulator [Acetanaerobacterium elongatum]
MRKTLIDNGLQLLNKVGYHDFSMRQVAAMSGVSHAAPYKHFKNKEDFLVAIKTTVLQSFMASLKEAVLQCDDNPRTRLAEMGKSYIKFMVENPEHMKFMSLTAQKNNIRVVDNHFEYQSDSPFAAFLKIANEYLQSVSANPESYVTDILSIFSVVHGMSLLIVEQSIVFEGDYMPYVSEMIYNRMRG